MQLSLVDVGSVTHTGMVRERNEDSCLVRTDIGLWAVADGMGGHEAGDMASQIVVRSLDGIADPASSAELLQECEERIFRANQEIMDLSSARNGAIIGTTAAILLLREEHYACVWAGDSRVYLIKNGSIGQVSRDHTEVEELVAVGALSREDARNWPNNVITRAVGVAPDLELEVVTGPVASGCIVTRGGFDAHPATAIADYSRKSASGALGPVGTIAPRSVLPANFSDHRILPVACITTNRARTEMIVIESPVKPFQKNA